MAIGNSILERWVNCFVCVASAKANIGFDSLAVSASAGTVTSHLSTKSNHHKLRIFLLHHLLLPSSSFNLYS